MITGNPIIKDLSLRLPKTSGSKRYKLNILAFSSCCTICTVMLYFALVLVQLILTIFWTNVQHELNVSMPRTFAWGVLVKFFGSTLDDCRDHSQAPTTLMISTNNCQYYHSTTVVPLMAITLSVGLLAFAIFYIVEKFCFDFSSNFSFKGALMILILQAMFSLMEIISICVSFGTQDSFVKDFVKTMEDEMKISQGPTLISPKWKLSQNTFSCCGIHNFTDWKFQVFESSGDPKYPRSCCNTLKYNCKVYPNNFEVWEKGCLSSELATVKSYNELALGLTLVGLISTILLVFVLYIMETIFRGNDQHSVKLCISREPPTFLKTSSNFTSLDKRMIPKLPLRPTTMTLQKFCTPQKKGIINQGQGDEEICSSKQAVDMNHTKCSAFTLRRHSNVRVCLNSYGICWNTENVSVAKTHVLKKETLV